MDIKDFVAKKVKYILKQNIEDYVDFLGDAATISQSTFDNCIDEISDKLYDFFKEEKISVALDGGADKDVLIFDDFDFVVKIPKVTGRREIDKYFAAEAYGFNQYFAEVDPIVSFKCWDKEVIAYFQKKVDFKRGHWDLEKKCLEDNTRLAAEEEKDFLVEHKIRLEDGSLSKIIRSDIFAFFIILNMDINERYDFLNFLIDEKINDINNNNFYISEDGELTIFDYSGYDDSYKYDDEDNGYDD